MTTAARFDAGARVASLSFRFVPDAAAAAPQVQMAALQGRNHARNQLLRFRAWNAFHARKRNNWLRWL